MRPDATTINILKALEMLVYGAKAGDRLVFQYSGHGSQVPDTSGDESDKRDEILCPVDLDWKENVIRDDDLNKIFAALDDGVHLEVFLDSCHSGTALRALEGPCPAGDDDYRKSRFLPMPGKMAPPPGAITHCRAIRPEKAQVLWAACKSNQYAADARLNGKYGGAFTAVLCDLVRSSQGAIQRANLLKSLRSTLKKKRFDQVPQLETSAKLKKSIFLG